MIYLDNAATTKLNEEVKKTIIKLYDSYYMNADSPYLPAVNINNLQEEARNKLACLLNVQSHELIYTSCGSEANNMAIKGIAFKYLNRGNYHLVTSAIEHSSVYETMKQLESLGFEVTYLKPNRYGQISNADILASLKDNTILVSIMKINSEIGAINDVEAIYDAIKAKNKQIMVHIDYVQAFGKYDLNLAKCDLGSFSAHKINGVKGSGLLYKKSKVTILPLISGGQQEFHLRAGTSNYFYNIALTKTLRLFIEQRQQAKSKERFAYAYELLASEPRLHLNSQKQDNSYFIINFSLPGYKPEVILNALEQKKIYLSTKSACSSKVKRSRVMDNLALADELKDSAFRISFDLATSKEEIKIFYDELVKILDEIVK